jgi:hypothetical protein
MSSQENNCSAVGRMRRWIVVSFIVTTLGISPSAWSFDGDVTATIFSVEVTTVGNYSFRVWLTGSPAMCGNSNQWAYLEDDAPSANYKTYVSTLLAAKQAREKVRIWSNRDASTHGSGHVGHARDQLMEANELSARPLSSVLKT